MSVNSIFSRVRLSGMASGLDTDAIIRDLMKAERIPLDRAIQQNQLIEWRRDDYREIHSLLDEFNRSYMDVVNTSGNMRSQAQYKKFLTSVSSGSGIKTDLLTATATVGAKSGAHTIIIKNIAAAASSRSNGAVSADLQSRDIRGDLELNGKKIKIQFDGTIREIEFNSDYTISEKVSGDEFAADFKALITEAFGAGIDGGSKVEVLYDEETGRLTANTAAGSNKIVLMSSPEQDALDELGFNNFASNRISLSATLEELSRGLKNNLTFYDDSGVNKIKFTINGKEFAFSSDTRLDTMLNTINNDNDANVEMSYDAISDKFSITAKELGAGKTISVSNTWGNFFGAAGAAGIDHEVNGFGENGQDAIVNLNSVDIVRSTNSFTENGIAFNLLKAAPGETITVGLTLDIDGAYNNIKTFIDSYNKILDKLNTKLLEKYDKDYAPLTDEQKTAMSESEIEKWEEKAKNGLLSNDSIINKIINDMRTKLLEPVEGVNISLFSIGISSKSYLDRGKLTVNESKLKAALQSDVDSIAELFTKKSEEYPNYSRRLSAAEQNTRYAQEGIANRLFDIVQENISIMMDSNGKKGILLEKAGLTGDSTEFTSILSKQLAENAKLMGRWEEKLFKTEEYYLKKFSAMETALSKMYSQSSWISNLYANNNTY